jgi:hypothetical protein
MALTFIGIDPETGTGQSPTIWIDEDKGEIVVQGWKPDAELQAECAATIVPGHAIGIPDGEAVVRIPARLVPLLRKACDAAEQGQL